jgi:predicted thioredoxin/glutaredoxin
MRLYIHPSCHSSYNLVKQLLRSGLLKRIHIVNTAVKINEAFDRIIWSVPWLEQNDIPLAADPLRGDEVEEIVKGEWARGLGDPVKRFSKAVLSSQAALTLYMLHGSIKPLLSKRLILAATRLYLAAKDELQVELNRATKLIEEEEESVREYLDVMAGKILAMGFVRELYFSLGGKIPEEPPRKEKLALWLLSKASLGRMGLPYPFFDLTRKVEGIYYELEAGYNELVEHVREEQEKIAEDKEFLKAVGQV